MSIWYRNHYGAEQYKNIAKNKKGYFSYDITLISKKAADMLPSNFNERHEPALHDIISFDELFLFLNNHQVQENGGNCFSGKIAINSELDYIQIL